ncbi:MAG: hypothetical protein WBA76_18240 [Phormidesmis sp.]
MFDAAILTMVMFVLLYALGIYGLAWFLRQFYPRRRPTFEPTLLMLGGVISGPLGLLISARLGTDLFTQLNILSLKFLGVPAFNEIRSGNWVASLLLILCGTVSAFIGIWIACSFKFPRFAGGAAAVMRASVPIGLTVCLYLLNYSGFPGANASAQARHDWGVKTFGGYDGTMTRLNECKGITRKIGEVTFVAPTAGENVFLTDYGSMHFQGGFTLEVVGTAGTGVAEIPMNGGRMSFTHQGKKEEKVSCQ